MRDSVSGRALHVQRERPVRSGHCKIARLIRGLRSAQRYSNDSVVPTDPHAIWSASGKLSRTAASPSDDDDDEELHHGRAHKLGDRGDYPRRLSNSGRSPRPKTDLRVRLG